MPKPILITACAATLLTLLKTFTTPITPLSDKALSLPEQFSLESWQWVDSSVTDDSGQYLYRMDSTSLEIQMTLQNGGDLLSKTRQAWKISADEFEVRERQDVGAYGIFSTAEAAYLTTCINPEGPTTATARQFGRNQLQQAIQPQHIVAWLIDQTAFRDPRCLRVTLSTPLDTEQTAEGAFQSLESVWLDLNTQWQPKFFDAQTEQM